jgi:hypothetical protein
MGGRREQPQTGETKMTYFVTLAMTTGAPVTVRVNAANTSEAESRGAMKAETIFGRSVSHVLKRFPVAGSYRSN